MEFARHASLRSCREAQFTESGFKVTKIKLRIELIGDLEDLKKISDFLKERARV
jgi:hypothetical protein